MTLPDSAFEAEGGLLPARTDTDKLRCFAPHRELWHPEVILLQDLDYTVGGWGRGYICPAMLRPADGFCPHDALTASCADCIKDFHHYRIDDWPMDFRTPPPASFVPPGLAQHTEDA